MSPSTGRRDVRERRLHAVHAVAGCNDVGVKVLVLGYRGRVRAVERWRVNVGVRTLAHHGGGQLVLSGCGGEAERLAALAPPHTEILLETTARNTRENVERSLPLLEGADQLSVASDFFHVRRALRYLNELHPGLDDRFVPPDRHWRAGWWIHAGGAAYAASLWLRPPDRPRKAPGNRS